MDMCVKKNIYISLILFLLIFVSCGPMDSLFPSIGNYKINVHINDISLDDCSFVRYNDVIHLYFDNSVSNDPDVTGLTAFLKDSNGMTIGWKVVYKLEINEIEDETDPLSVKGKSDETKDKLTEDENEQTASQTTDDENDLPQEEKLDDIQKDQYDDGEVLLFIVKSLDDLPVFPIPNDLSMGRYTIVFHIMGEFDVLQKIEKPLFYLSRTGFSYEGIIVNLPGIAESTQIIPRATIVMLETNLKIDNILNPYIIWYNGKNIINEGKFSDGAGSIFWKTPEESGFFSLRAVVYPIENHQDLSGFQKDISLLVSSKPIDFHLLTNEKQLLMSEQNIDLYRYIFESNLNDSKMIEERTLKHSRNNTKWKTFNGTYGVSTGFNNIINMPKVLISNPEYEKLHISFRFKPINNGGIFSIKFGKTNNVYLHLYLDGPNLILTLTSANNIVSQVYTLLGQKELVYLPGVTLEETEFMLDETFIDELFEQLQTNNTNPLLLPAANAIQQRSDNLRLWIEEDVFFTVSINITIQSGLLSAQLNVLDDYIDSKLASNKITIETKIVDEFQIMLGFLSENNKPMMDEASNQSAVVNFEFTAIWDEIYYYHDNTAEDITKLNTGKTESISAES